MHVWEPTERGQQTLGSFLGKGVKGRVFSRWGRVTSGAKGATFSRSDQAANTFSHSSIASQVASPPKTCCHRHLFCREGRVYQYQQASVLSCALTFSFEWLGVLVPTICVHPTRQGRVRSRICVKILFFTLIFVWTWPAPWAKCYVEHGLWVSLRWWEISRSFG